MKIKLNGQTQDFSLWSFMKMYIVTKLVLISIGLIMIISYKFLLGFA